VKLKTIAMGLLLGLGIGCQSMFATNIVVGFDLLTTAPGAFLDATGFGLGIIPLVGVPLGPGNTDTIIERDNGFNCAAPPCLGNTVNTHVFALSLVSAAPVNIGGSFFDIYYEINDSAGEIPLSILPQPDVLNPSTGTLTVDELTASGGTFDSSLTIWADVIMADVGQGRNEPAALANGNCATPPCHFAAPAISLSSTGGTWSTSASVLDAHNLTYPAGSFFIDSINQTGPLPVDVASIPEPGTFVSIASGALMVFLLRRGRRAGLKKSCAD
jgi:hypothetical protein